MEEGNKTSDSIKKEIAAVFNFQNCKKMHPDPIFHAEPRQTVGVVIDNGNVLPGSSAKSKKSWNTQKTRHWFGQDFGSIWHFGGGRIAGSKNYVNEDDNPPIPPRSPNLDAAISGLLSLIWHGKKQTREDDLDLGAYQGVFGSNNGYNIIGMDNDTGLIIILTKGDWSGFGIFDAQDVLYSAGVDIAVVTDGGGSTACDVKEQYQIRGYRHNGALGRGGNLVTNYLAFEPK